MNNRSLRIRLTTFFLRRRRDSRSRYSYLLRAIVASVVNFWICDCRCSTEIHSWHRSPSKNNEAEEYYILTSLSLACRGTNSLPRQTSQQKHRRATTIQHLRESSTNITFQNNKTRIRATYYIHDKKHRGSRTPETKTKPWVVPEHCSRSQSLAQRLVRYSRSQGMVVPFMRKSQRMQHEQ